MKFDMDYENRYIIVEKHENKVAKMIFNKPPLNLNSKDSMTEMRDALRRVDMDDEINVLVITGTGKKAFNCGSDLSEYESWKGNVANANFKLETDLFNTIEFLSKPVIAAIEGYCLGGGFELALSCDFRIMSETAKVSLPEIELGVFPGSGGMFRLPKIIGQSKALEIMFLGDMIDASICLELGIADRLVDEGKVIEKAMVLAGRIAAKPSNVIGAIKKGTREFWLKSSKENYYPNLEMIEDIYNQYNAIEGIDAFLSKRKPDFK
jgi:enoyl-CoA hydratase/carnithine racemase